MKKNSASFDRLSIKERLNILVKDDVSGISFTPVNSKPMIHALKLDDSCLEFEETDVGIVYHVLLYTMTENGKIEDIDQFEAVLAGPEVYVENIIKCGFYGLIMKKSITDDSKIFVDNIKNTLCEIKT